VLRDLAAEASIERRMKVRRILLRAGVALAGLGLVVVAGRAVVAIVDSHSGGAPDASHGDGGDDPAIETNELPRLGREVMSEKHIPTADTLKIESRELPNLDRVLWDVGWHPLTLRMRDAASMDIVVHRESVDALKDAYGNAVEARVGLRRPGSEEREYGVLPGAITVDRRTLCDPRNEVVLEVGADLNRNPSGDDRLGGLTLSAAFELRRIGTALAKCSS
jgi:hypothetical protein